MERGYKEMDFWEGFAVAKEIHKNDPNRDIIAWAKDGLLVQYSVLSNMGWDNKYEIHSRTGG